MSKLDVVIFTLGPILPEIVRSAVPLEHYDTILRF